MMPQISFVAPRSVQGVLETLDAHGTGARILAGGTDIIPGLHQNSTRFNQIEVLVDLHKIPELSRITEHGDEVHIGAAATLSQIAKHPWINERAPILASAAGRIGSVQIRNRATLAGNFVNNSPCADSVPPLLVHEAVVWIVGPSGERQVPLEAFLVKPYQSQLQTGELVTKVVVPAMPRDAVGEFVKLGRRRGVAISRITLAAWARMEGTRVSELRLAGGAVTPIGTRFRVVEEAARGASRDRESLAVVAQQLGKAVLEVTGLRWSSAYKLPVVQQLFFQLLCRICRREEERDG